jgi:hypothetical protein
MREKKSEVMIHELGCELGLNKGNSAVSKVSDHVASKCILCREA